MYLGHPLPGPLICGARRRDARRKQCGARTPIRKRRPLLTAAAASAADAISADGEITSDEPITTRRLLISPPRGATVSPTPSPSPGPAPAPPVNPSLMNSAVSISGQRRHRDVIGWRAIVFSLSNKIYKRWGHRS